MTSMPNWQAFYPRDDVVDFVAIEYGDFAYDESDLLKPGQLGILRLKEIPAPDLGDWWLE
jgi:hypothetical protein